MNSSDCERISAKASARSFDAAVTRSAISPCTFTPPFRTDQFAGGGYGTQVGQLHGLMMRLGGTGGLDGLVALGGLGGCVILQPGPAQRLMGNQECRHSDQFRAGKAGRAMW